MRKSRPFLILLLVGVLLLTSLGNGLGVEAADYRINRQDLEKQIYFDYDETLFTLYAFLNYTGFDANNGMPYSPVRKAIRDDLAKMKLDLADKRFFINQGFPEDYYDFYIMVVDGPPHFNPVLYEGLSERDKQNYGLIPDLISVDFSKKLAEFYKKANIHQLYEKYRPQYMKEINRYKKLAYDGIEEICNSFKLDPKQAGDSIVVDVNYLMQAGRSGTTTNFSDYRRGYTTVMMHGPNPDHPSDGSSAIHEVLHHYVNPILDKEEIRVRRFIQANGIKANPSYDVYAMVDEIFVRALQGIPSGVYKNSDFYEFPRSQDIFNYYFSDYDQKKDNLERFIVRALDKFSGGAPPEPVEVGRFSDVTRGIWYDAYVHNLRQQGIVSGYKDSNRFGPDDPLTREQAAKMIAEAAGLVHEGKKASFSDVPASSWATGYIAALVDKGGVSGFKGTQEFKPQAPILRSHVSKMVALAFDLEKGSLPKTFSDMPQDKTLQAPIQTLASNGIVGGYKGTDQFRPDAAISRAEFAKIVAISQAVAAVQKAEKTKTSQAIRQAQARVDKLPKDQDVATRKSLQKRLGALPASGASLSRYDGRDQGRLTPVKGQGSTPSCWAFATTAALEAAVGDPSMSFDPFHLYNNTGYDKIDDIGQYLTAVPYYAAWKGPVLQHEAKKGGAKQVLEVQYLPLDLDLIKDRIYQYGAVASTIHMTSHPEAWSESHKALYNRTAAQNHAIALVGWDDDYPKGNFPQSPPADGAFIAKNSYGSQWGEGGYFYISYYDRSLGQHEQGYLANIVFSRVEEGGYFDKNYQYDELGQTASWGTRESQAFANVFEIKGDKEESLAAVSFYALGQHTSYEVFLVENYRNESSFTQSRKIASGQFEEAGYYTVESLDKIRLKPGQKLAIMVKLHSPGCKEPVAVEIPHGVYQATSKARSKKGQSFVEVDGKWLDFYSLIPDGNVCIKLFTRTG